MILYQPVPQFLGLLLLIIASCWPLEVAHAEAVYNPAPPAQKITTKKKYKKRLRAQKAVRKKAQKKPDNIIFGLYVTFALLILLPVLVVVGILLIAFGFPSLPLYILGASLVGVGNIGVILAGLLTGKTSTYNTQALYFSVWVLFGINLAAVFVFALLYSSVFVGAPLLLFLLIGVAITTLIFLFWGALIARKKRNFKRASQLQEQQ